MSDIKLDTVSYDPTTRRWEVRILVIQSGPVSASAGTWSSSTRDSYDSGIGVYAETADDLDAIGKAIKDAADDIRHERVGTSS